MPKYPTFISDLAEDERKHLTNCINKVLPRLRGCEGRLRTYLEGVDPYSSGSVFKLLQELKETQVMIDAMQSELTQKHRLPDDLNQISEALRQDFRNVLLGFPLH